MQSFHLAIKNASRSDSFAVMHRDCQMFWDSFQAAILTDNEKATLLAEGRYTNLKHVFCLQSFMQSLCIAALFQGKCKLTTQQKQQLRDATREYMTNTINLHLQRDRLKEELMVQNLFYASLQVLFFKAYFVKSEKAQRLCLV